LIGCAVYPVALALHRVSGEGLAQALTGLGLECAVDVEALWRASDIVDEHIGDEPVTPLAPRVAARAAEHSLPAGLVAALDVHLRAHAASDRSADVREEELLLLGLFGEEAEPLLRMIRGRSHGEESLAAGAVDQARAERIREIVRIVQDSGVGEVTIEDDDLRVTVRRTDDRLPDLPQAPAGAPLAVEEPEPAPVEPPSDGLVRVEAPMVGTFYRASQPGAPPFVEEGDPVAP